MICICNIIIRSFAWLNYVAQGGTIKTSSRFGSPSTNRIAQSSITLNILYHTKIIFKLE